MLAVAERRVPASVSQVSTAAGLVRGLATKVFALLAVEAGDDDTLSHGDLDAGDDRAAQCDPARADRRRVARRYDGWVERERPVIETAPATEPRARRPMVPRWQNDV